MKYSIGTATDYYRLPISPVLRFDGTNYMQLQFATQSDFSVDMSVIVDDLQSDTNWFCHSQSGFNSGWILYHDGDKVTVSLRNGDSVERISVLDIIQVGVILDIHLSITGRDVVLTVNDQTREETLPWDYVVADVNVQVMGRGDGIPNVIGDLIRYEIDGIEYIKQGDQDSGTVVPSHPEGDDGELKNGAVWTYREIGENYVTQDLFLADVTSPTEPVTVEVITRGTDVSDIPSEINGQPVEIKYTWCKRNKTLGGYMEKVEKYVKVEAGLNMK